MADAPNNPDDRRPGGGDPLASLHRMSTTAGISSQEYVAINPRAVAALLVGLMTVTVFLSPLWMAVPVLAIALGVVALRQISHSNGTQSGRLLAWGGILIATGLAGSYLASEYAQELKLRPLRAQVLAVCDGLDQSIRAQDYPKAWTMFSERFRDEKKIDYKAFQERWAALQSSAGGVRIKSMKSTGRIEFEAGPTAGTRIVIEWSNGMSASYTTVLRQHDGVWQIDDMPVLFVTPLPPPPGQGGSPAGPQ